MAPRPDQELVLGIDAGTSGLRAVLFDLEGEELASRQALYEPTVRGPIEVEQEASSWIVALRRVVPELLQSDAARPGIGAVAVTSQRATIVPVDAAGEALMPAINWRDKRSRPQCDRLAASLGEELVFERTGLRIDPYFSLPKIMWIAEERPQIHARTRCFLTVQDLIVHHLTGALVTDTTQASRTMLMDL